jgi:hypothetical protein
MKGKRKYRRINLREYNRVSDNLIQKLLLQEKGEQEKKISIRFTHEVEKINLSLIISDLVLNLLDEGKDEEQEEEKGKYGGELG